MIPVIVYNKIDGNYKLQRKNNNKKISANEFVNNNKKLKEKFHIYLNNFITKLNENIKDCDFENFCNNVKNVEIEEKYSDNNYYKTAGYLTNINIIRLYKKNFLEDLNHELLHMASNKIINRNLILNGFSILDFKKLKKYGTFITEGYTEYLNNKYFNSDILYKTQVKFVKLIEKIIGGYLMQQMYFNADLKGFINELIKYKNTKEEVLEFIINTDIMDKCRYSINPLKRLKLKRACIKVNAFLVKSYYIKLLNDNLEYNKIVDELTNFMNELVDIDIDFKSNYYYMDKVKDYYDKEIKKEIKRL